MEYIKSETYRFTHTPAYKRFLIASVLIIALTLAGIIAMIDGDLNMPYTEIMTAYAFFAVLLIDGIALTITYKNKDTKVQVLTYGIKREEMYIKDFVSYIIMILISMIFLLALSIISGLIIDKIGPLPLGELNKYLGGVGEITLINLNLAIGMFGLAYLMNNVALGIFGQIMLIPLALQILSTFLSFKPKIFEAIVRLNSLQPMTQLQTLPGTVLQDGNIKEILLCTLTVLVLYFIPGLIAFKKREIY